MNTKVFNAILFTTGAAIGSVVTWKLVKTKYENIAQEEIDSVKEEYLSLSQKMRQKLSESVTYTPSENEESDDEEYSIDDREMIDYCNIASKYITSDDESDENDKEGDAGDYEVQYINGPYVISPEDFNSSPPGYDAQPLNYFADGILADDWGVVLDIEETIGEDSLAHFGEYDDDIVYVRNERTEIDYEVTKDPRTYEESIRTNPNPQYNR